MTYELAGLYVPEALYGAVVAILLSFIEALYDAWILRIEINR